MENRLKSLSLAGYKSIKLAEVEFGEINVLIGANGAGKSNLISFFKLLNFLGTSALQRFAADQGYANSLLHFGAKRTPAIEATLTFSGETGDNRYHLKLAHAAGDRLVFLDESIQYRKSGTTWDTAQKYSLAVGHLESALATATVDVTGKTIPPKMKVIRGLMGGWRVFQFHDTSGTARVKQAGRLSNDRALMSDAGNLAAFLHFLRDASPVEYGSITATIRRVFPMFGEFVLEPHPTSQTVQLNWRHRSVDDVFGPHQLSDGTLRFVALAALLLQPRPPAIMFLDEPELGLHPFAIELLGGLLRSVASKSQVILSTQSVALANQFEPEQFLVVDSTNAEFPESQFRRLNPAELADWLLEYGLGDLWAKNLLGGTPS